MNFNTRKSLWVAMAIIIFSLMMLSNSAYAELPKAAQADKYKLLISESLKSEDYKGALKNIRKLEALKVKIPASIMYYKGESYFHLRKLDNSKEILEAYILKTGSNGKYYKDALSLINELEKDVWNEKLESQYASRLNYAASQGVLYRVKRLLDEGAAPDGVQNKLGWAALTFAAEKGNYRVAKELIVRGANVNHNAQGVHPLERVLHGENLRPYEGISEFRFAEVAEILIKSGSNLSETIHMALDLTYWDHKNNKPVTLKTLSKSRFEILKIILENGADVNERNNKGKTPLDIANENGLTDAATLLKKHGAKIRADL